MFYNIIKMLNLKNEELVVDEKGIYSIENFLIARRLMYWQVYLHRTCLTYENMLISTLLRAKELTRKGVSIFAPPALKYFLENDVDKKKFFESDEGLNNFIQLDDSDIWTSLKVWTNHNDKILSMLSKGMINRILFKTEIATEPFHPEKINEIQNQISEHLNISVEEAKYFISSGIIENKMYNPFDNSIDLLYKDGSIKNIAEASDMLNVTLLSQKAQKYYLSHYRMSSKE